MSQTQRAAIFGVTGFVGRGLPALFAGRKMATTGVSRRGSGDVPGVTRWQKPADLDLTGHTAIINLAGEPIAGRWTAEAKRNFHESRVGTTTRIVEAIAKMPADARPKVLVNASAIGLYGDRGDDILNEKSKPGQGYLADLCEDWENVALDAVSLGVRVVTLRIGMVLGNEGGALHELRKIFKLGLGGRLGSGKQWVSWIHLEDLRAAILHCVFSEDLSGAVNGTAPYPERNRDFTRRLAAALHRPAILPAPAFALRMVLGEFSTALLASQRVIPAALDSEGFQFRFPTLETALLDLTQ